jgi:hypothetical protein
MQSRFMTSLVLIAILLQGVFGSLQGSVVICLGGGHQHEVVEAVEQCPFGCTHEQEWPATASGDGHLADCDCIDIELGLIVLLSMPRIATPDFHLANSTPTMVVSILDEPAAATHHIHPPNPKHDPGTAHRITILRSTRLIV